MIEGVLTLQQAAEQFGVSVWMLRQAVRRGTIPAELVGSGHRGIWFVRCADVAAYLTSHAPRVPQEPRP